MIIRACPEHLLALEWRLDDTPECPGCGPIREWVVLDSETGLILDRAELDPEWLKKEQPWEVRDSGSLFRLENMPRNSKLLEELEWWSCL